MSTCSCNETLGNTGQASCQNIAKVTKKIFVVPLYANDGTRNGYTVATPLTQNVLDALINQADASKRWYPLPELETVTNTRADSTFETAPSGKKAFIKQGIRNFSGEIWNESSLYKAQLDKLRCAGAGVYIIDAEGSLRGMVTTSSEATLYPIEIDKASWDVRLIEATDTTIGKLMLSFDWEQNEDDALLRMISSSSIDADLLGAKGLLDIIGADLGTGQTSLIIKLTNKISGNLADADFCSGLVAGDFALYNDTDAAAVTVLTAVENPTTKSYTLTYASQTVADLMTLTVTKAGKDFTQVSTLVLTV